MRILRRGWYVCQPAMHDFGALPGVRVEVSQPALEGPFYALRTLPQRKVNYCTGFENSNRINLGYP